MARTLGKYEVEFMIDVTGETTGEPFKGKFACKTRLSHNDHLRRDQVRRALLGVAPGAPDARADSAAEIFSQLAVRLVDAPSWWTMAENGKELYDDKPVAAVYDAAMKAERDAVAAVTAKGEEAKGDLPELKEQ